MNAFTKFFKDLKHIRLDKKNIAAWKSEIGQEALDPRSDFNKFNLTISEDQMNVSYIVSIPENYQIATNDSVKYQKLMELIMPVNRYFLNIGWGEYMPYRPEFYYIESEIDDEGAEISMKDESCTYLAVWKFAPKVINDRSFWIKFSAFVGVTAFAVAGIVGALLAILL